MEMDRIEDKEQLDRLAREFRYIVTDIMCRAGGGHIGGSLSLVEIIITLYFRIMNLKPDHPRWEDRDLRLCGTLRGDGADVRRDQCLYCGAGL